jgi:hypothetical protein
MWRGGLPAGGYHHLFHHMLLSVVLFPFAWLALAADISPTVFAERALRAYLAERKQFQENPNSTNAWQFGRACFDWADFALNDTQRAAIAEEGIAACRRAALRSPSLAAGHYYLSMNLGQLARTKLLGALKLVEEMETEFKLTAGLDSSFDFAGADRGLGLLYLDAPGWPTSIGSKSKARAHLTRAAVLAPDFPENRLNLIEALIKWDDKKALPAELKRYDELLPKAKAVFASEAWESSWHSWDGRWQVILKKVGELMPKKTPAIAR